MPDQNEASRPVTITLPLGAWVYIEGVLSNHPLPFNQVSPIINEIRAQANPQTQPMTPPKPPKE